MIKYSNYSGIHSKPVYTMNCNLLIEGDSIAANLPTPVVAGLTVNTSTKNAITGSILTDVFAVQNVLTRVNALDGLTTYKLVNIICGWNDASQMYLAHYSEAQVRSYVRTEFARVVAALRAKVHCHEIHFATTTRSPSYTDAIYPGPPGFRTIQDWFDDELLKYAATDPTHIIIVRGDRIIEGSDVRMTPDGVHPGSSGQQIYQVNGFNNSIMLVREIANLPTAINAEAGDYRNDTIVIKCSRYMYAGTWTGSDFTITGTGATISSVTTSLYSEKILIKLSAEPLTSDVITIAYTKGANALKDIYWNELATFTAISVINNLKDNTAPVYVSSEIGARAKNILCMKYSQRLDSTIVPAAARYTLAGITGNPTINSSVIVKNEIRHTLSGDIGVADTPTVAYTKGANPLQDTGGNQCASLTAQSITNNYAYAYEDESIAYKAIVDAVSGAAVKDYLWIDEDIKKLKAESLLISCQFFGVSYGGIKNYLSGGVQDGVDERSFTIYDASGNLNHVTQAGLVTTRPFWGKAKINNIECVNFEGDDSVSKGANGGLRNAPGGTLMLVYKKGIQTAVTPYFFQVAQGTNAYTPRFHVTFTASTGKLNLLARRVDTDGTATATSTSAISTNPQIATIIMDYANAKAYMYLNGALDKTQDPMLTAGSTSDTDSLSLVLGGNLVSDVALWILFNKALSSGERTAMEVYFAARFGITI